MAKLLKLKNVFIYKIVQYTKIAMLKYIFRQNMEIQVIQNQ